MMKSVAYLILICVQVFVHSAVLNEEELILQKWTSFKIKYGKEYKTKEEDGRRMKIFLDNERKIAEHNELYEKGEVTYKKEINNFADLTDEEFVGLYLSDFNNDRSVGKDFPTANFSLEEYQQLSSYKNWAEEGYVSPVKSQEGCGSCWAFAAVGALEAHVVIQTGKKRILSEQNLVDCVKEARGCNKGGRAALAYEYVIKNGGIALEKKYPYQGQLGSCQYNINQRGASIQNYIGILPGGEEEIKKVVATTGPVAVAFNRGDLLKDYSPDTIYTLPRCEPTPNTGHQLVIVGYGTDEKTGRDYWWVKNSWGTHWDNQGYFAVARNMNTCGIANNVFYPIGVHSY